MTEAKQGHLNAKGLRFAIVVSRFNDLVCQGLLNGALDCLERHGAESQRIDQFRVPGCFEIPQMAQRLASSGRYDALVCLGTLIRGETSHFDALCSTVFKGLAEVGRSTGVPVGLGVLTAESLDQALERAGGKLGNRGADAALSVIEMANLFRTLES
jgi:6,7-dimethyl-8-ribityllumazine synthase